MSPHIHSLAHHSSHKYLRFRKVSSPVPSRLPPPGPHSEALLPAAAASTTPSGGGPTGAPCSLHAGAGQRGPWTATTGTQHGRQVSVHLSKARSKSNWWVVLAVQSVPADACQPTAFAAIGRLWPDHGCQAQACSNCTMQAVPHCALCP